MYSMVALPSAIRLCVRMYYIFAIEFDLILVHCAPFNCFFCRTHTHIDFNYLTLTRRDAVHSREGDAVNAFTLLCD